MQRTRRRALISAAPFFLAPRPATPRRAALYLGMPLPVLPLRKKTKTETRRGLAGITDDELADLAAGPTLRSHATGWRG